MKTVLSILSVVVIAASSVGVAVCQEKKKEGGDMAMGAIQPGPHHGHLKMREGTWDATIKMTMPGMPESESKGVETDTMMGGLWLVGEVKSDMMGMPFQGHSMSGYDTTKNKYVEVWADTMGTGLSHGEGTCDGSGKVITSNWEGPGPDGKMMKWRQTDEMKDKDNRVFTMYQAGPDGKESSMLTITYKRKK